MIDIGYPHREEREGEINILPVSHPKMWGEEAGLGARAGPCGVSSVQDDQPCPWEASRGRRG